MNVSAAHRALTQAFDEASDRAARLGRPVLAAVSVPIDRPCFIDLFARWHDTREDTFFWKAQDPCLTLCGHGRAATLRADGEHRFDDLSRQWRHVLTDAVVSGPRTPLAIGGFRFDATHSRDGHWRSFPSADMALPRMLLIDDGATHVMWQQRMDMGDDPESAAGKCLRELDTAWHGDVSVARLPVLSHTTEMPARHWQRKVHDVLGRIEAGDVVKVVLAREVQQHHEGRIGCADVLRQLATQAGGAHLFAFMRDESCFLGATPERLVRVQDGVLHTHALAGSTRRGETEAIDTNLAHRLMDSTKDGHEHALVVDAIVDALTPLTTQLDVDARSIKRLTRIQHLCTPIQGLLRPQVGVLDTVAALHPTPAVAGLPRLAALDHIRRHEGFDRGWYAAPVGWIDGKGDGDFLVALRSGLLTGADCRTYAGCGIVRGSDPVEEFQETCLKLAQVREALLPTA